MKFRSLIASCLVLLMTACSTVPPPKTAAPEPVDPATSGMLRIYRPDNGIVGKAVDYYVFVNGFKVARLNSRDFVDYPVNPGTHYIVVQSDFFGIKGEDQKELTVNVEPKQEVFVRFSLYMNGIRFVGKVATASGGSSLGEVTRDDWALRR